MNQNLRWCSEDHQDLLYTHGEDSTKFDVQIISTTRVSSSFFAVHREKDVLDNERKLAMFMLVIRRLNAASRTLLMCNLVS